MTSIKSLVALAGVAFVLVPSTASAAQRCGDSKPHGITTVMATKVSCKIAVTVAQKYNYYSQTPKRMNGWSCKGTKVSSTREKVTCRKGARRITFRSTFIMELPAAPQQPNANAG